MTSLIIVFLASIGVFFVAFFSPQKGKEVQQKSGKALHKTQRKIRNSHPAMHQALGKSSRVSHKTIHKSAELGKTARKKVPF